MTTSMPTIATEPPKSIPVKIFGMGSCSEAADKIFAPSIFLFGCNLRCPYCMNSQIVLSKPNVPDVDEIPLDEIKRRLEDDDSDWLMISGGEPLMSNTDRFIVLLEEIKSWGRKIGLSTNGTYPDRLGRVLPLLNYVTMDLKSPKEKDYRDIYYLPNKMVDLAYAVCIRSMPMLRQEKHDRNDFDYEYRTTLYPGMIDEEAIVNIGKTIWRNEKWVLQQFRHAKYMLDPKEAMSHTPYNKETLDKFLEVARRYVDNVSLRYV